MESYRLPPESLMRTAFLASDGTFDGIFWTGVRSTGIFCRPTCPARKPNPEQLAFFSTPTEAEAAGYRPCKRCRPLELPADTPEWITPLLERLELEPSRRVTEADLRRLDLQPERVRRWFQAVHGMTFQAFHRAYRLGTALEEVQGGRGVAQAAFAAGYDSLSGFQEAFRQAFGGSPTSLENKLIVRVGHVVTPLGPMLLGQSRLGVHLLEFTDRVALDVQLRRTRRMLDAVLMPVPRTVVKPLRKRLARYFDGKVEGWTDVRLEPAGTVFQREVWRTLQDIPAGKTVRYSDVAVAVGRPSAVRAVGRAVGANPLAILVPCHRVVGSDGRLTGYAGGLWRKRRLLDLERVVPGDSAG